MEILIYINEILTFRNQEFLSFDLEKVDENSVHIYLSIGIICLVANDTEINGVVCLNADDIIAKLT